MDDKKKELLERIEEKYKAIGQDPTTYLEGLVHQKPVTYWDYIHTDTLLDLQKTRTDLPDEEIFIMYHQVTELFFKMIRNELEQVCEMEDPDPGTFKMRIERVDRYLKILTMSFDIMRDGMEVEQYMKFRNALSPASGFQSAQYRMIEFISTDLGLLVNKEKRGQVPEDADPEDWFDELYWQEAMKDPKTGKKNLTLGMFEEKYKDQLLQLAREYKNKNIRKKWDQLSPEHQESDLKEALRNMDHTVNVEWPLVHLRTAEKYLESQGQVAEATGGSPWKKYLHPAHQRRIFFPELWSEKELENWGNDTTV